MNVIYKYWLVLIGFLITLSACNDEKIVHSTTITDFIYYTNDLNIDIKSVAVDKLDSVACTLKWGKSKALDYSLVFYEVIFSSNDNFSDSVYSIIPTTLGTDTTVKITYRQLNVIAESLGIKQNSNGNLKWKVRASNGFSELKKAETRTISIIRPAGYAYYPEKLYLLGSATSAGDSIKKAIPLKSLGNGIYEIFINLSDGKYYFIEKLSGRTRHFAMSGNTLVEENVNNSPIEANKTHRLRLNFINQSAKATVINKVSLWYSGTNSILGNDFTQENPLIPTWTMQTKLELVNGTNGLLDYRYKFRTEEKDAEGTVSTVFWGSEKISSAQQTGTTDAAYFYMFEVNSSQSDYCYKFSREGQNGKNLKFKIDLQSASSYTHSVSVVE